MRRVTRHPLDATTQAALEQRQAEADRQLAQGTLRGAEEWKRARQTNPLRAVLSTLRAMMGERERCMYCLDSHGTDIEHFWPKTPYPARMFQWLNLLLCCAECGRLKGDRFPLAAGEPLLVDPTAEDPWRYLDFDPLTGNIVARFEIERDDWSPKGLKTVEVLQLDRREALATGYRRTFLRLSKLVRDYLQTGVMPAGTDNDEKPVGLPVRPTPAIFTSGDPVGQNLPTTLAEHDEHGLLGWCLVGAGRNLSPFVELREQQPALWRACLDTLEEI